MSVYSKKTVSILLICLLLVGLSSCKSGVQTGDNGSKNSPDTSDSPSSTESSGPVASGGQEKMYWEMLDEVDDTSDLPDWKGDKLDITVWYSHGTGATGLPTVPENDVFVPEIERVTGVHLNVDEFFDNNGVDLNAKLPLMMAGGDFPDLVFASSISSMSELIKAGKLYDLTPYMDYIDQFTKKVPMDEYRDFYANQIGTDGGIYLLSTGLEMDYYTRNPEKYPELKEDILEYMNKCAEPLTPAYRTGGDSLCVREDILLGLYPEAHSLKELTEIYLKNGTYSEDEIYDVPLHNANDFFKMLEDIQKYIDDNNLTSIDGKKMEVTYGPYVGTDNWFWMEDLPQLIYGKTSTCSYFNAFNADTVELEVPFKTEEGKAQMKNLNTLLRKGIIAPDSLVDDKNTFTEKLNNGYYAVTYVYNGTNINSSLEKAGSDIVYRPVHIKQDWDKKYPNIMGLPSGKGLAIFKDSISEEELPQLLHWANYLFSDLHSKLRYWGPRSAGLYKEQNGKLVYTDPELEACMVNGVQNGANAKYGLGSDLTNKIYVIGGESEWIPNSPGRGLYSPKFMYDKVNTEADVIKYFSPYVLGKTLQSTQVELLRQPAIYSYTMEFEEISDWWNARKGFEDQMKKVIAADTDQQFEKAYNELLLYSESSGLTDEVIKQWSDYFFEVNDESLRKAGIIN